MAFPSIELSRWLLTLSSERFISFFFYAEVRNISTLVADGGRQNKIAILRIIELKIIWFLEFCILITYSFVTTATCLFLTVYLASLAMLLFKFTN